MDLTRFSTVIVGLVAAVIMFATVLVPVINDTGNNLLYGSAGDSAYNATFDANLSVDGTYEFTRTAIDPTTTQFTMNGKEIDFLVSGTEHVVPIIISDSFVLLSDGTTTYLFGVSNSDVYTVNAGTYGTPASVTFNNGQVSYRNGNSDPVVSESYSTIYYAYNVDGSGQYGLFTPGSNPQYDVGSFDVYVYLSFGGALFNVSSPNAHDVPVAVAGTQIVKFAQGNPSGVVYFDNENGYVTPVGFGNNGSLTNGYFFIPMTYVAHPENQSAVDLFMLIPILVIISIVVMATGFIIVRGRDY